MGKSSEIRREVWEKVEEYFFDFIPDERLQVSAPWHLDLDGREPRTFSLDEVCEMAAHSADCSLAEARIAVEAVNSQLRSDLWEALQDIKRKRKDALPSAPPKKTFWGCWK